MATAFIESKQQKAQRKDIEQAVAEGRLPAAKPNGKRYDAAKDPALNPIVSKDKAPEPSKAAPLDAAIAAQEQAAWIARLLSGWRAQAGRPEQTLEEWKAKADAYDPTCGMQDKAAWAHDFMMEVFMEWLDFEARFSGPDEVYNEICEGRADWLKNEPLFDAAHIALGLSVAELKRLQLDMIADASQGRGLAERNLRYFIWKNPYTPAPAVLPQQLQASSDAAPSRAKTIVDRIVEPTREREDQLDAAAEAKWKVKPAKIDELLEAIHFAILHPQKLDAQILTDGFAIYKNAHAWKLTHPAIEREPVIATRLDDTAPFRDVARRADVRECLIALRETVAAKQEQRGGNHISSAVKVVVEQLAATREFDKTKVAVGPSSQGYVDTAGKVWGL